MLWVENINTKSYWDKRFNVDWENRGGREQTVIFIKEQIARFKISPDFDGTILDFGCAMGDAMPVLQQAYPKAKLMGIDISSSAIESAKQKYGDIATFIQGTNEDVPDVDIIISSNVFEHLSNDKVIADSLRKKCKELYIVVPFKEYLPEGIVNEHVNSYDDEYYKSLGYNYTCQSYVSEGWSEMGSRLLIDVYFKNLIRPFLGKKLLRRRKQIMFHFNN